MAIRADGAALARDPRAHVGRVREEVLRRLSDRFSFQALGCVLGFALVAELVHGAPASTHDPAR